MSESPLFRQEAVQGQVDQLLGHTSVALSLKTSTLVYLFAWLALLASGYAIWGSYTRRVTVGGFILPSTEVLRLYAPHPSIVTQRYVQEGTLVRQGERLFTVSSERQSAQGPTQGKISESLLDRMQLLEHSVRQYRALLDLQTQDVAQRLQLIAHEMAQGQRELTLIRRRHELARRTVWRFEQLARSGFVSPMQLEQKEEERLEVERSAATLARALAALQREKAVLSAEQHALPLRQKNQEAELKRSAQAMRQALLENDVLREQHIVAPEAGRITAIAAQPGANVGPQRPLGMLVPQHAPLEAQLFAPSKAIGFIRPGARVKLRLEAFPYQKFGHVEGTVSEVARTAMLVGEIPALVSMEEPLYRIRVALDKATIRAYGQETALLPSMRVTGDIMLETRRLYEWAFEPLYSVTGKW